MSRARSMSFGSRASSLSYPSASAFYSNKGRGLAGSLKRKRMPKSTAMIAKQAWLTSNYLSKVVKPELKTHNFAVTATTTTTTPVFYNLSSIAQSDDYTGRTGRKITVKSLEFKVFLQGSTTNPITAVPAYDLVRVFIFIDTAQDGVDPVSGETISDVFDFRTGDLQHLKRFRVLYDQVFPVYTLHGLTADSLNGAGQQVQVIKEYRKLDLSIAYQGTAAADASNGINSLFACFVGTKTTAATGAASHTLDSRIRFLDS